MMTLTFNNHQSIASPTITQINSSSTTKALISSKNLFSLANRQNQSSQRNLGSSSVFLLNDIFPTSESDLNKSDRPNRSNIRPASWILMEDGLYGPPQKHINTTKPNDQIHDLYDQTNDLSGDSINSSFITNQSKPNQIINTSDLISNLKPTSNQSNSILSNYLTTKSNSSYSPLAAFLGSPIKPSTTTTTTTTNSNLKPNPSNSLLATFYNSENQFNLIKKIDDQIDSSEFHQLNLITHTTPIKISSSTEINHSHIRLNNSSSNHIQLSNQSIKSNQIIINHHEINKPNLIKTDNLKEITQTNPTSDQVTHHEINKPNPTSEQVTHHEITQPNPTSDKVTHQEINKSTSDKVTHHEIDKSTSEQVNHHEINKLTSEQVNHHEINKSTSEQVNHHEINKLTSEQVNHHEINKLTSEQVNHHEINKSTSDKVTHQSIIKSKVETFQSMITPPVTPLKKPMRNPVIIKDSFGSKFEVMTRESSTGQSSTDEFQSIESFSVESIHPKSNHIMKRPVTSVYTEELMEEEVYNSSEQDNRCLTLSSPSSIDESNSTRSESFPITPNSERIRSKCDSSSSSSSKSKSNQFSNEENEIKSIVTIKLEDILLTSPNRILKRILFNLTYLDFFNLSSTSINLKQEFINQREITEIILERYLGSIGYCRKTLNSLNNKMTEKITLKDLQEFYTGLEFGNEEIGKLSREMILKNGRGIDKNLIKLIKDGCRAYNRILIHIREHTTNQERKKKNGLLIHLGNQIESIWKEGRAGVFKVWVPTRESWMSNEEVVECERELWRSQVWPWLKKGDVCWNTGLGEFANEGKMIFDGKYLRDLLFEFDSIGHLPSWLNMMNFPPVYFHRIIESSSSSPIFYLDLSNFGKEVSNRMKLCKDQIEMNSPLTRYRVQRWVYRSIIEILPEMLLKNQRKGKKDLNDQMIDLGWIGRIVIEVEGTSECARELLKRCSLEWSQEIEKKNGSFSGTIHLTPWRIIREKCGPGKMWIRPVLDDERI